MNGEEFKYARVLVASGKSHVVQVMRHVLAIAGVQEIGVAASAQAALDLLVAKRFNAVFCDDSCSEVDGKSFAYVVRRHPSVLNPMVPLFLVCAGPRFRDIELARDTGFSDVLCRPVSAATVIRKLRQVIETPRSFIASSSFFGPDRRAKQRPAFQGAERRVRSGRKVKLATDSFTEV
jgi:CheY-like chemotaxis protein